MSVVQCPGGAAESLLGVLGRGAGFLPMTVKLGKYNRVPRQGGLVDGMALSALARLHASVSKGKKQIIADATEYLGGAILDRDGFDQQKTLDELIRRGVTLEDVIDDVVPAAARNLGAGWCEDSLSFARVSAASSRLFALCKAAGREWNNLSPPDSSLTVVVASFRREDHLLGPGVLVQQLRRRQHSVTFMSNTAPDELVGRLRDQSFDAVLISVASLSGLETAGRAIRSVRRARGIEAPIILGGAALEHYDGTAEELGVDIVTSDLDVALDWVYENQSGSNSRKSI